MSGSQVMALQSGESQMGEFCLRERERQCSFIVRVNKEQIIETVFTGELHRRGSATNRATPSSFVKIQASVNYFFFVISNLYLVLSIRLDSNVVFFKS